HVLRVDRARVDLHPRDLTGARHGHRDQPATRRAGDRRLRQLGLRGGELLLHLLRLLHDLLQVRAHIGLLYLDNAASAYYGVTSPIFSAPKVCWSRRNACSSLLSRTEVSLCASRSSY